MLKLPSLTGSVFRQRVVIARLPESVHKGFARGVLVQALEQRLFLGAGQHGDLIEPTLVVGR